MDGAASVIAVVSIAIQLADSVKKLSDFWKSIEAAPLEVQTTITSLNCLNLVLQDIAIEAQHAQPNATLEIVLSECGTNIQALNSILHQLEPGFSSTKRRIRKWAAFKSALERDKIKRPLANLDRLKGTLMLALQAMRSYNSRIQFQQHRDSLATMERMIQHLVVSRGPDMISHAVTSRQDIATSAILDRSDRFVFQDRQPSSILGTEDISSSQDALTVGHASQKFSPRWRINLSYMNNWIRESICGSIGIRSSHKCFYQAWPDKDTEWTEGDAQSETQTIITIRPAEWLSILGIENGFNFNLTRWSGSSVQGWKHTLSSFRVVPDNAQIFQFCREGNLTAVRDLLTEGKASVKDTNSIGMQPLHLAAEGLHTELCKLLIRAGADRSAHAADPTFPNDRTPLAITSRWVQGNGEDPAIMIDTIRLFLDTFDFSDPSNDGWEVFMNLVDNSANEFCEMVGMSKVFEWLFLQFSEEMKANFLKKNYERTLSYLAVSAIPNQLLLWLKLGPKGTIDTHFEDGSTLLAKRLIGCDQEESETDLIEALLCGADPNLEFTFNRVSPRTESPTSLSMFSRRVFSTWLFALREAKIDADIVFDKELRQGILSQAGWTREAFQRLTDWEHDDQPQIGFECKICLQHPDQAGVSMHPIWLYSLEEIKNGKHPDDTMWAVATCSDAGGGFESDVEALSNASKKRENTEAHNFEVQNSAKSTENEESDHVGWDADIFLALHESFCETRGHFLVFLEGVSILEAETEESSMETVHFDFDMWNSLSRDDIVCMTCWLRLLGIDPQEIDYEPFDHGPYYHHDFRSSNPDASTDADTDESSEHEFSPFLIHS